MLLNEWDKLPIKLKTTEIYPYYQKLEKKKLSLFLKKCFDLICSFLLLILLTPAMLLVSAIIKIDSKGPVMFRQTRITQYGREFQIFKFRTMVNNASKLGAEVTTLNDIRVTRVGKILRKYRIDEIPQLINVLVGDMSFVGTRPEVPKYIEAYTNEMLATLLLPAGITSEASIEYKDEERLLNNTDNAEFTYIHEVLPQKMKYNLKSLKEFHFWKDLSIMLKTVLAVIK